MADRRGYGSRWLWLAAGAAWATPSCLAPLCFLLLWQSAVKTDRKSIGYSLAGASLIERDYRERETVRSEHFILTVYERRG